MMKQTKHITLSRAARVQGVTRQTIANWEKHSGFPVDRSGPWPVVCVNDMNVWRENRGLDPISPLSID